jgi:predicted transcriptional regulator
MRRVETKKRYKLSNQQTLLLLSVFKYRFITSELLAELLHKDRSTIYERLAVLVEQGYIVKKYESTYRIDRRPATYYLAPAGIRYLKSLGIERTQIHYKNKTMLEAQIDEYYRYPKYSMAIHQNYPDTFRTHTKYQLDPENYLKPMPWLLFVADNDETPDYFMEYIQAGELSWIIRKRINKHIEYADEEADYNYPYILFVAGNDNTEKRIVKMSDELYWDSAVFTTTEERLLSGRKDIWLRSEDVDWDEELEFCTLPMGFEE